MRQARDVQLTVGRFLPSRLLDKVMKLLVDLQTLGDRFLHIAGIALVALHPHSSEQWQILTRNPCLAVKR